MKKTLILFGAIMLSLALPTVIHAQSSIPCVESLNAFFGGTTNETPVVLNRLGTSPQFGEIKVHTAEGAYSHLKKVYARNLRASANEIDRYLQALGYTGFKDPEFNVSKITAEILPAGSIGWMGAYGKGHKYRWSKLGRDFETYRIQSKSSPCYSYIMKKCGNAFYVPADCSKPNPCPECIKGQAFVANPMCPCTPCPVECVSQTISVSGNNKIASGDIVKSTADLSLVATNGIKKLCLGTFNVPLCSTFEYAASGSTSLNKTIQVCDKGQGALSNININLPVALSFDLADSQLKVGDNGVMTATIASPKRFKALSKVYSECPAEVANSSAMVSELKAPEIEAMSESGMTSNGAMAEAVDGQDCKKQTLYFNGSETISDVTTKSFSNDAVIIGHFVKTKKLVKGETADKYLCLGQYSVPGTTSLAYTLKGESSLNKVVEICDKEGMAKADENIELPVDLKLDFTNQNMSICNGGRMVVQLTEKQYNKLAKRFSRCCADGSASCR